MRAVVQPTPKQWFSQRVEISTGQPLSLILKIVDLWLNQQRPGVIVDLLTQISQRFQVFVLIEILFVILFANVAIAGKSSFGLQHQAVGEPVTMLGLKDSAILVGRNQVTTSETQVVATVIIDVGSQATHCKRVAMLIDPTEFPVGGQEGPAITQVTEFRRPFCIGRLFEAK